MLLLFSLSGNPDCVKTVCPNHDRVAHHPEHVKVHDFIIGKITDVGMARSVFKIVCHTEERIGIVRQPKSGNFPVAELPVKEKIGHLFSKRFIGR